MRRGTAIPALIALAIGVLIVRLRRARAGAAPRPVAGSSTAASLPAAPPAEAELAMAPPTAVPMPTAAPTPAREPELKTEPEPGLQPPTARFLSVPWQLSEPASDGSELTIEFARNGRMALDRVDVQETPTLVFVTVIVRMDPAQGEQPMETVQETAAVALARPLGERELIHGATDADDDAAPRHYP